MFNISFLHMSEEFSIKCLQTVEFYDIAVQSDKSIVGFIQIVSAHSSNVSILVTRIRSNLLFKL